MTSGTDDSEGNVGRDSFSVFGSTAVLLLTDAGAVGAARDLADRELAAIDLACSRFRPDSEISALNQARGTALTVTELFADLIAVALRAARLTGGAVDPTCGQALIGLGYDRDFPEVAAASQAAPPIPSRPAGGPVPGWRTVELDQAARKVRLPDGVRIDLGATAKAWAADRCATRIAAQLGCGALVSLGGDIAVAGPPPAGDWRVRVTDDHAAGPTAAGQTVSIAAGGLATSSTTVRTWSAGGRELHHIIDPATGEPAGTSWRTVSVAAGSCLDANTASTAAIVLGPAAPGWLGTAGLPARLVRPDGSVVTTGGWPADDGPADTGPMDGRPAAR